MDDVLIRLTNPAFKIEYGGQTYEVTKANMQKVALMQQRIRELAKNDDPTSEANIGAYAVFLILKDKVADLTEEKVSEAMPGDTDVTDLMVKLGFLNPSKAKAMLEMSESPTTGNSLSESPSEPAGDQATSPN